MAAPRLVDPDRGLISRNVFDDRAVLQQEVETLFPDCWQWIGHTSQVASPGDFVTASMGGTPVLLWRDERGGLRLFSNICPHQEARVCPFDEGQAERLSCGSHLWTFNSEGLLVDASGAPASNPDAFDQGEVRLTEVLHLEIDHGFIFGSLNPSAPPLLAAFGNLGAWWECLAAWGDVMGGWEVQPYSQRWRMTANWKHFTASLDGDPGALLRHPALQLARVRMVPSRLLASRTPGQQPTPVRQWEVEENLVHGGTERGPGRNELESLGPEVREFIDEGTRRWREQLAGFTGVTPSPGTPLLFPNLVFGGLSLLTGLMLLQVQPRTVSTSEISARYLLPRHAPGPLRQVAAGHARQVGTRLPGLELRAASELSQETASRAYYREWATRILVG